MKTPDSNPIEHLWNIMEPHVQGAHYNQAKECILGQVHSIGLVKKCRQKKFQVRL